MDRFNCTHQLEEVENLDNESSANIPVKFCKVENSSLQNVDFFINVQLNPTLTIVESSQSFPSFSAGSEDTYYMVPVFMAPLGLAMVENNLAWNSASWTHLRQDGLENGPMGTSGCNNWI